ncbi:mucin-3B-like [Saccostrea cucullata]|uniref:mucin-3B-like n=1 Tax=Saccostrea cuccullata TaxID=36930 RepID=UPI002ED2E9DE
MALAENGNNSQSTRIPVNSDATTMSTISPISQTESETSDITSSIQTKSLQTNTNGTTKGSQGSFTAQKTTIGQIQTTEMGSVVPSITNKLSKKPTDLSNQINTSFFMIPSTTTLHVSSPSHSSEIPIKTTSTGAIKPSETLSTTQMSSKETKPISNTLLISSEKTSTKQTDITSYQNRQTTENHLNNVISQNYTEQKSNFETSTIGITSSPFTVMRSSTPHVIHSESTTETSTTNIFNESSVSQPSLKASKSMIFATTLPSAEAKSTSPSKQTMLTSEEIKKTTINESEMQETTVKVSASLYPNIMPSISTGESSREVNSVLPHQTSLETSTEKDFTSSTTKQASIISSKKSTLGVTNESSVESSTNDNEKSTIATLVHGSNPPLTQSLSTKKIPGMNTTTSFSTIQVKSSPNTFHSATTKTPEQTSSLVVELSSSGLTTKDRYSTTEVQSVPNTSQSVTSMPSEQTSSLLVELSSSGLTTKDGYSTTEVQSVPNTSQSTTSMPSEQTSSLVVELSSSGLTTKDEYSTTEDKGVRNTSQSATTIQSEQTSSFVVELPSDEMTTKDGYSTTQVKSSSNTFQSARTIPSTSTISPKVNTQDSFTDITNAYLSRASSTTEESSELVSDNTTTMSTKQAIISITTNTTLEPSTEGKTSSSSDESTLLTTLLGIESSTTGDSTVNTLFVTKPETSNGQRTQDITNMNAVSQKIHSTTGTPAYSTTSLLTEETTTESSEKHPILNNYSITNSQDTLTTFHSTSTSKPGESTEAQYSTTHSIHMSSFGSTDEQSLTSKENVAITTGQILSVASSKTNTQESLSTSGEILYTLPTTYEGATTKNKLTESSSTKIDEGFSTKEVNTLTTAFQSAITTSEQIALSTDEFSNVSAQTSFTETNYGSTTKELSGLTEIQTTITTDQPIKTKIVTLENTKFTGSTDEETTMFEMPSTAGTVSVNTLARTENPNTDFSSIIIDLSTSKTQKTTPLENHITTDDMKETSTAQQSPNGHTYHPVHSSTINGPDNSKTTEELSIPHTKETTPFQQKTVRTTDDVFKETTMEFISTFESTNSKPISTVSPSSETITSSLNETDVTLVTTSIQYSSVSKQSTQHLAKETSVQPPVGGLLTTIKSGTETIETTTEDVDTDETIDISTSKTQETTPLENHITTDYMTGASTDEQNPNGHTSQLVHTSTINAPDNSVTTEELSKYNTKETVPSQPNTLRTTDGVFSETTVEVLSTSESTNSRHSSTVSSSSEAITSSLNETDVTLVTTSGQYSSVSKESTQNLAKETSVQPPVSEHLTTIALGTEEIKTTTEDMDTDETMIHKETTYSLVTDVTSQKNTTFLSNQPTRENTHSTATISPLVSTNIIWKSSTVANLYSTSDAQISTVTGKSYPNTTPQGLSQTTSIHKDTTNSSNAYINNTTSKEVSTIVSTIKDKTNSTFNPPKTTLLPTETSLRVTEENTVPTTVESATSENSNAPSKNASFNPLVTSKPTASNMLTSISTDQPEKPVQTMAVQTSIIVNDKTSESVITTKSPSIQTRMTTDIKESSKITTKDFLSTDASTIQTKTSEPLPTSLTPVTQTVNLTTTESNGTPNTGSAYFEFEIVIWISGKFSANLQRNSTFTNEIIYLVKNNFLPLQYRQSTIFNLQVFAITEGSIKVHVHSKVFVQTLRRMNITIGDLVRNVVHQVDSVEFSTISTSQGNIYDNKEDIKRAFINHDNDTECEAVGICDTTEDCTSSVNNYTAILCNLHRFVCSLECGPNGACVNTSGISHCRCNSDWLNIYYGLNCESRAVSLEAQLGITFGCLGVLMIFIFIGCLVRSRNRNKESYYEDDGMGGWRGFNGGDSRWSTFSGRYSTREVPYKRSLRDGKYLVPAHDPFGSGRMTRPGLYLPRNEGMDTSFIDNVPSYSKFNLDADFTIRRPAVSKEPSAIYLNDQSWRFTGYTNNAFYNFVEERTQL